MTVPPANPPRPGGIIACWSGTAYSTRQVWLISQLTSISEGLSPIRHPGTRLVGGDRPTTELEVAYSRWWRCENCLLEPHRVWTLYVFSSIKPTIRAVTLSPCIFPSSCRRLETQRTTEFTQWVTGLVLACLIRSFVCSFFRSFVYSFVRSFIGGMSTSSTGTILADV